MYIFILLPVGKSMPCDRAWKIQRVRERKKASDREKQTEKYNFNEYQQ